MRIGAHVSTAGGLDKGVDRAVALGVEAIQIFGSAPQAWAARMPADAAIQSFRTKTLEAGLNGAVFLHGVYLVNLAAENPDHLRKGIDSLTFYLSLAHRIGAQGVIFHVGSHKGAGFDAVLPRISDSIGEALAQSEGEAALIIENNAGQGNNIGGDFLQIRRIMDEVGSGRMKVCLDTQHSIASGYDVRTADGLARALQEFDDTIGIQNLVAVHANDSKVPLGQPTDRHENIGEGFIGLDGFLEVVRHPAFKSVPFLLEVPGMDGKSGPDEENIRRLRLLRDEAGVGV